MAIQSDDLGFIVGEKQFKEMAASIDQTRDNTENILNVLVSNLKEAVDSDREGFNRVINRVIDAIDSTENNNKPSEESKQRRVPVRDSNKESKTTIVIPRDASERPRVTNSASDRAQASRERQRDGKGRFIGQNKDNGNLLNQVKDIVNFGRVDGDVHGYDPTIDALTELKDVVSPVGSVFSKMTGKAVGLFRGRMRKRRSDEVLPDEQAKANRREEASDKERNKLLKRLIDVVRGAKGRLKPTDLLSSLLGGGLGRGKGILKLGRGVLKRLPLLGALIGGGLLAKDWNTLNSGGKGKGIGEIVGGLVGSALGTFFGPVGTIAGGGLGVYLGGIFGQKVGEWTDDLKEIDFAKLFIDFLSTIVKGTKDFASHPMQSIGGWGKSLWDKASQGAYNLTGGAIGTDVASSKSPIGSKTKDKQLAVFNAVKKAGFNNTWAAGLTAAVGRENDYQDKYLFGKHQDKAGGTNMGMISWQGDRQKRLNDFMSKRGLLDGSGNIIKGQASLDAQGAFIKQEIDTDPAYSHVKEYMKKNPNASKEDVARVLGKGYVKWAYGQSKLRNGKSFDYRPHLAKEYNYRDSIDSQIKGNDDSNTSNKKIRTDVKVPYALPEQRAVINSKPSPQATKGQKTQLPQLNQLSKVNSPAPQQAQVVINKQDGIIAQNISDRNLAHVITGGLGSSYNA
ncbi:phage tail tip lysozyme [Acinetobacter calcoaceticus]